MSFPKAKITRFNELPVTTPSPAKHVDDKQRTKGIDTRDHRFVEPMSPCSSEGGFTRSALFRTPSFMKKKKLLSFPSKAKLNIKQTEKDLLQEKNVECKTKDTMIDDLTKQIEEFKEKIASLQEQYQQLEQGKQKFNEEVSKLVEKHVAEVSSITEKHEIEIQNFKKTIHIYENQIDILRLENERLKNDYITLQMENDEKLASYTLDLNSKSEIIENTEQMLLELKKKKERMKEDHEKELLRINQEHQEAMQKAEFEMLKCIEDLKNTLEKEKRQRELEIKEQQNKFQNEMENLKLSFAKEKKVIENQNIAKLKQLEQNMSEVKVLFEIQCKEKCTELETYWKARLDKQEEESTAILKECQAISEYNVIQCEIEKNEFKFKLEAKTQSYKDLEKKYDDIYFHYKKLQTSYTNVQNKLYRVLKQLREMEVTTTQMNKLSCEKQTYETTISRCQETIGVLKKRLEEAAHDIDQLKSELSENEKKLLEYEHKFNVLSEELKNVAEFSKELEIDDRSTIKITQQEIKSIKEELLKQITDLQVKMNEKKMEYKEGIQLMEKENRELLELIEKHYLWNATACKLLSETNLKLEKLSSEKIEYLNQIENLTSANDELRTDIANLLKEKNELNIGKKEQYLNIALLKNEFCRTRKQEVEFHGKSHSTNGASSIDELIATLEEHLTTYETNRNVEKKLENLVTNDYEEWNNPIHRYIIEYIINLHSQNEELLKKNQDLDEKVKAQDKKLEKLKRNNSEFKKSHKKPLFEDKENILSPNRSIKCGSPGPLKELN